MLDFIRRSTQGGFGKVIMGLAMGLLIISFAIWGIGDIFRARSDAAVARVGGEKISAYELQQAFQRELTVLRRQPGAQDLTAEQARAFGLDRRALAELVNSKLFDLAAADLGIGVPDSMVVSEIHGLAAFQGDTGRFDRSVFERALQSLNYTEASFIDAIHSDLLRKQLVEAILGGLPVPNAIAGPLMTFSGERRSVRYIVLPAEQAGTLAPVADEEIRARYENAKGTYMAPEYRHFTFVDISPAALAKTATVKDEEIRARYDQHKDDYGTPETRALQQLVFQTEMDARAAAEALKSGKSFEDLAKAQGKTTADISLGDKTKSALAAKIADAVFAAPAGGVAGPLEGPFGWMLVRVVKITPAAQRSFDELKGTIAADIAMERGKDEAYALGTKFADERDKGASIEEAAKAAGLAAVTIDASDADGKSPAGLPVPALEGKGAILADAFKASPDNDPELVTAADGAYYIVRVDRITPPAQKPFDAVKDEIRKSLEAEKRSAALAKLAQDLAAKGKAGTALDALASSIGKAALKGGPLIRTSEDDTFSRRAVQAVFAAKQGDFVTAPVKSGTGYVLLQVDGIEKPSATEVAAAFGQIKPQIGEMIGNEIVTIYTDKLQARYRVTVNDTALQSAVGGGS